MAARDEGAANFLTDFRPNGDVLQIRVGRGEPAGRRDGLVKARVHAMGLGIDQQWQGIDVGAFELAELTKLQDLWDDGMLVAQAFEDRRVCRVAAFGLPATGEIQVFKEKSGQLLRRVDVDRPVGDVGDLLVQPLQLVVQFARDLLQVGQIDRHPGQLHLRQHGNERHLEIAEQLGVA